jgi:hypothetical protein
MAGARLAETVVQLFPRVVDYRKIPPCPVKPLALLHDVLLAGSVLKNGPTDTVGEKAVTDNAVAFLWHESRHHSGDCPAFSQNLQASNIVPHHKWR